MKLKIVIHEGLMSQRIIHFPITFEFIGNNLISPKNQVTLNAKGITIVLDFTINREHIQDNAQYWDVGVKLNTTKYNINHINHF